MNITALCPGCSQPMISSFDSGTRTLKCQSCNAEIAVGEGAIVGNDVQRCLVCPSNELFVRKDFPQRLGVTIVVVGFVLSSFAWYYHLIVATFAILLATALIDICLYLLMGDVLECYRCHAQYRGVGNLETREGFDLEVHEKYRQQQARLKQSRVK